MSSHGMPSQFEFADDLQPITVRLDDRIIKKPNKPLFEMASAKGEKNENVSIRPSISRAHSALSPNLMVNKTFTQDDDDFIKMCE